MKTSKRLFEHIQELKEKLGDHEEIKVEASAPTTYGNTKENLQSAADGEHYEHTSMYPGMEEVAKEEGFKDAQVLFGLLAKVELEHENRFKRLLGELEDGTLYSSKTGEKIAWVCRKCGNVHYGEEPPEKCPVCTHPKGYFERRDESY